MNVESLFKHQNKTNDNNRYKGYFFAARVSQVKVKTMERIFEQRFELQVAENLIVLVLSSSYNVSSIDFRNKKKTMQQGSPRVANDIVLNQVLVYHEKVYADNVMGKFWILRSFSAQHYIKFITIFTSGNVSQIRTEECKTRSFSCKVSLTFFRSSTHFN